MHRNCGQPDLSSLPQTVVALSSLGKAATRGDRAALLLTLTLTIILAGVLDRGLMGLDYGHPILSGWIDQKERTAKPNRDLTRHES